MSASNLHELHAAYAAVITQNYAPVTSRALVDGARTGIAAELLASDVDANLPYTPDRVDERAGLGLIDAMVARSLACFGDRLDAHRLVLMAIDGEIAALRDPLAVVYFPQRFAERNAALENERVGGIDAVVFSDPPHGTLTIEHVWPGGPAERAGLHDGEQITAIDGRPTATIKPLFNSGHGKIGTVIRYQVLRAGVHVEIPIVRAEIVDPEEYGFPFGRVSVIGLSHLGDRAGAQIVDDVVEDEIHGPRPLVLDLRGTSGGNGAVAARIASVFVSSGPLFMTRTRAGIVVSHASGASGPRVALAVLVDGDTSDAAEIVAEAIQAAGAGTIVGTRTAGRAFVRSFFRLADGSALQLTTGRYTSVSGRDIEGTGVIPDVLFKQPPGASRDYPGNDPALLEAASLVNGTR